MMQTEPVDGSARTEGALPEIAQKFDRAEKYAVLIWLLASAAVTAVLMLCGNRPLRALFGIWLAVTFCSVPLLCIALETVQRVLLRPVRQDDSLHETEAYSAEEGRRALRRFFTARAVQYVLTVLLIGTGVLLFTTAFYVLLLAVAASVVIGILVPKCFPAPDTPAASAILQMQKHAPHRRLFVITLVLAACFFGAVSLGYEYTAVSRRSSLQWTAKALYNAIGAWQTDCEKRGTDPALWKLNTEYGRFGGTLVSPEMTEGVSNYFSDFRKYDTFYYKIIGDADGLAAEVWISRRPITASTQPQTYDEQTDCLKSVFRYKDAVASYPYAFS